MRYTLEKVSSPGWEMDFASEEDACKELLKHVCKSCLLGELEYVDSSEPTGFGVEVRSAPNKENIYDLLATPCGCEFWFEDNLALPANERKEGKIGDQDKSIAALNCQECGALVWHYPDGRETCSRCAYEQAQAKPIPVNERQRG